jgi:hypothetical protein
MFPTPVAISDENIVEDHRAETQHDQFSYTSNVHRCIKTIGFKVLPPRTFFIAERKHILTKDVAKKTKFETFVHGIGGDNHFIVAMKKQNLAALWMREKLKDRQKNRYDSNGAQHNQNEANGIWLSRINSDNATNNRGRKDHRQPSQYPGTADLIPLDYNHGDSSFGEGSQKSEARSQKRGCMLSTSGF